MSMAVLVRLSSDELDQIAQRITRGVSRLGTDLAEFDAGWYSKSDEFLDQPLTRETREAIYDLGNRWGQGRKSKGGYLFQTLLHRELNAAFGFQSSWALPGYGGKVKVDGFLRRGSWVILREDKKSARERGRESYPTRLRQGREYADGEGADLAFYITGFQPGKDWNALCAMLPREIRTVMAADRASVARMLREINEMK